VSLGWCLESTVERGTLPAVDGGVPVEELDLSIRAYHVLKVLNMDFIEQINLEALNHPWGREVRPEIAEKLRGWRDDTGEAPSPSRRR
jgi:hypothetical protein